MAWRYLVHHSDFFSLEIICLFYMYRLSQRRKSIKYYKLLSSVMVVMMIVMPIIIMCMCVNVAACDKVPWN